MTKAEYFILLVPLWLIAAYTVEGAVLRFGCSLVLLFCALAGLWFAVIGEVRPHR